MIYIFYILIFFQCSDLRWNNIGIVGGRSIVNMLQYNKTLTELELAGNNITHDIVRAVGKIV